MVRLVSVIVPTKQRPDLLREALSSIRAIEGPDLQFEILVGDNGRLPETRTIAEEFGCLYFSTTRNGAAAARNLGLAQASGEFVAFLDDDDVWTKDTIRPHIAIMDADPGIAAAFGQIAYVTPDLEPVGQPWPETAPSADRLLVAMLSGYFPQIGATVVKANVARAIGLMDEELLFAQDWDWQLRIARDHRIAFVNQTCVLSRIRALGSFDDVQMLRTKYIARIFQKTRLAGIQAVEHSTIVPACVHCCKQPHLRLFHLDSRRSRKTREPTRSPTGHLSGISNKSRSRHQDAEKRRGLGGDQDVVWSCALHAKILSRPRVL